MARISTPEVAGACWVAAILAVALGFFAAFTISADTYFYYSTSYLVAWRLAVLGALLQIVDKLSRPSK